MAVFLWSLVMSAALLMSGCQCTHFDPLLPDNTTKYVCTGSTAVLPWTVTLDQGDEIVDIQWYFRGRSDEMIAMFAHGNFLAMPAFSARIRHMPNAGVAVSHVTPSDSGRYYVQIMGRNSLGFFSLLHEATLVVTDSVLTSNDLMVSQLPHAIYNNSTRQWNVALTCGYFVYPGTRSPIDVQWVDPTGVILTSSFYTNGAFYLLLNNPVKHGNYTCRIPTHATTCQPRLSGKAVAVAVDRVVAKVTVLEALQDQLLNENVRLKNDSARMKQENLQLKQTVLGLQKGHTELVQQTDRLTHQVEDLTHQVNSTTLGDLLRRVQHLETARFQRNGTHRPVPEALSDQVDLLNDTVSQCCQRVAQVAQENALLTQQQTELSQSYQNLSQEINQSSSSFASDVADLGSRFQRVEQQCSSVKAETQSLEVLLKLANEENLLLDQHVASLESEVNSTRAEGVDLSVRMLDLESQLNQTNEEASSFRSSLLDVQSRLDYVVSRFSTSDVSFHVLMSPSDDVQPKTGESLILSRVISNRGNAYNATSGNFTAPHSATYLFIATISSWTKGYFAQAFLMVDDEAVGYVETYTESHYESGTEQAVVHLSKGQTVWLMNNGDCYYNVEITSFSGSLITLDP